MSKRYNVHSLLSPVGSASNLDDAFVRGAALAAWVTAHADYCDGVKSGEIEAPDDKDPDDLSVARPGGEWYDVAPAPPPFAYVLAGKLIGHLESVNRKSLACLMRDAAVADGATEDTWVDRIDAESFGHSMMMQWMGHGVSWSDNHRAKSHRPGTPGAWSPKDPATFEYTIGSTEISWGDFDPAAFWPEE
jgi:hypothetical protein